MQAKEGGATDPVHASEAQEVVMHVPLSPINWLNYLIELLNGIFNNKSVFRTVGYVVNRCILCLTCNTVSKEPEWMAHPESDAQTWKT